MSPPPYIPLRYCARPMIMPATKKWPASSPISRRSPAFCNERLNYLSMPEPGKVRIGISGWTYKPWRGVFYPEDLKQKRELEYASTTFNSIEINGTFYSLQRPSSFSRWNAETPDDFVFSVKAPRFITHIRRLREVETPVANFMASGLLLLGKKLGPILWQFPPNFKYQPELLENFFKLLPHDSKEAVVVAQQHDLRIKSEEGWEISGQF